jgi:hypothetical protein
MLKIIDAQGELFDTLKILFGSLSSFNGALPLCHIQMEIYGQQN